MITKLCSFANARRQRKVKFLLLVIIILGPYASYGSLRSELNYLKAKVNSNKSKDPFSFQDEVSLTQSGRQKNVKFNQNQDQFDEINLNQFEKVMDQVGIEAFLPTESTHSPQKTMKRSR